MGKFLGGCALAALCVGMAGAASAQTAATDAVVLTQDEHVFIAAVGHHVADAASAYEVYVRRAAAIDAGFRSPEAVQAALRIGADYQPDQLQEGIVAYAALVALRDPDFVAGVQAQNDPGFADRLATSPEAVLQVAGARDAAADVMGVLRAHGAALRSTGKAINQAAYDVQAQSWSKGPVADPAGVLAAIKALAVDVRTADEPNQKLLLKSISTAPRTPAAGAAPSPAVVRGLAVAALALVGRNSDQDDGRVKALLRVPSVADCLKLARMNLNQCLAAAGPHYDDVFCAGEHAVGETGKCVSAATETVDIQPTPELVPHRMVASYGPEEAAAYGYPAPYTAPGQDQPPQSEQVAAAR